MKISFDSSYVSREIIHITDWYPTLGRVGSDGVPQDLEVDGVDQFDLIFCHEEPCKSARNQVVYNIQQNNYCGKLEGAIRDGQWKFIRSIVNYQSVDTLYNIVEDEVEAMDLSSEFPQVLKEMQDKFDELAKSMVPYDGPEEIEDERQEDEDGNLVTGWCEVPT